jgi:hypothetical protein
MLKWARENECPWDAETCSSAARAGHLDILKWARENECPCDYSLPRMPMYHEKLPSPRGKEIDISVNVVGPVSDHYWSNVIAARYLRDSSDITVRLLNYDLTVTRVGEENVIVPCDRDHPDPTTLVRTLQKEGVKSIVICSWDETEKKGNEGLIEIWGPKKNDICESLGEEDGIEYIQMCTAEDAWLPIKLLVDRKYDINLVDPTEVVWRPYWDE